jgi:serine/threonine-protein kinase
MDNLTQPEVETAEVNADPAEADPIGKTLGDFYVMRRLGQGGMGQIYLAEQITLHRYVALKILRPELAEDPVYLGRFQSEATAIARANHANIVQVHAIGEALGVHYMALEYVEGRNLRAHLAKKGPPDLSMALSIMRQASSGLQRASELGIVHRDIKPENILLTRKGEVKIADFGLSRSLSTDKPLNLTQPGVTLGTPLYMSPEQVQGQQLDHRSDMYSFGVTCYHMLAGQPPFKGETAFQVALQHVQAEAPSLAAVRPDLPTELCAMVHKMMAKKPEDRYQTPRELLKDIARLRESLMMGSFANINLPAAEEAITTTPVVPAAPTATIPKAPVPGPRPRSLWPARGLELTLALTIVLVSALFCYRLMSPASAGRQAGTGESATDVVEWPPRTPTPQKREQSLRRVVEQYLHPGDDRSKIAVGLGHCVELALFYLEQRRLDEADDFFTRLEKLEPPVRSYRLLAGLGHATVLAYRHQPGPSDELFQQLLLPARPTERTEVQAVLRLHPNLREMIGQALEQNRQDLPDLKLPLPLEDFRRPPTTRAGGGTPGKKP